METPVLSIPIDHVRPSRTNPRKNFDKAKLGELAESLKTHGMLQPILVRKHLAGYEVVAGERRYLAAKIAGFIEVPAIARELSDLEVLEIQVIENLQRDDLHPLEEAHGYRQLMLTKKYDVAAIAARVGRSTKYVYDRVKLLELIPEAQKLFLEGEMTAGHAILLARLSPADQKRALKGGDGGFGRDGLFTHEETLFDPRDKSDVLARKAVSVREFQGWIDEHVKFDRATVDPVLFPETAATLREAAEAEEKIIPITLDYRPDDDVRDEGKERIYGERAWKRADGDDKSKKCENSVIGVIVCGPGRGEAFRVCIAREKCKVHWASEQREKAARAERGPNEGAGARNDERRQARWAAERQKAELDRARWKKAVPAILLASAAAVKTAKIHVLAEIVAGALARYGATSAAASQHIPVGKSAEDALRHLAMIRLLDETRNDWRMASDLPHAAKSLGVNFKKIVDERVPVEKPKAAAAPKKPLKKRKVAK